MLIPTGCSQSLNTPEVCFAEFVIRAALDVLIDAGQLIQAAVNDATSGIVSSINGIISVANS